MIKKVVIIEDELILQELHMHYVTNLGHDVVACFENGIDAVEFFKDNHADLILMDIRLEGEIDGIETAKKIQETLNIPIVYVSANTNDNVYNRALTTNMNGYLSKPLSSEELENVIESIVSLTDSLVYAQRIQKQLFAKENEIKSIFKEYIYINRPKDIVSGDFCFIGGGNANEEVIVAVALHVAEGDGVRQHDRNHEEDTRNHRAISERAAHHKYQQGERNGFNLTRQNHLVHRCQNANQTTRKHVLRVLQLVFRSIHVSLHTSNSGADRVALVITEEQCDRAVLSEGISVTIHVAWV